MSPTLKGALVREVARRAGNLNDVATGILAERFGATHAPTGRRSPLAGSKGDVLLRMPEGLKQRIEAEARRTGQTVNERHPGRASRCARSPRHRSPTKGTHG